MSVTEALAHPYTRESYPDRAAWLAARRHGIGGSDAPAVLGVSPWKTSAQLWAEKLEMLEEDAAESEAMRMGRKLEPIIRELYTEATGQHVLESPPYDIRRSRTYPWMTATLDGVVFPPEAAEPGVFEAKTASAWHRDEWATEPPVAYQVQVQHNMVVTGATWGVLAVLIGGQHFRHYRVERNDAFVATLIEAERA